jgi:hypothetical protein
VVTILQMTLLQPSQAATDVQGQPDHVQVQAENATVGEVLHALSGKFGLSYKIPEDVARTITGTFSGTLRQVLDRLLDGNDYIVNASDGSLEVLVLRASGTVAVAATAITLNNDANAGRAISPVASAPAREAAVTVGSPGGATPPAVPPLNSFLSLN